MPPVLHTPTVATGSKAEKNKKREKRTTYDSQSAGRPAYVHYSVGLRAFFALYVLENSYKREISVELGRRGRGWLGTGGAVGLGFHVIKRKTLTRIRAVEASTMFTLSHLSHVGLRVTPFPRRRR